MGCADSRKGGSVHSTSVIELTKRKTKWKSSLFTHCASKCGYLLMQVCAFAHPDCVCMRQREEERRKKKKEATEEKKTIRIWQD